jgi:dipicolinate synthase subunit A
MEQQLWFLVLGGDRRQRYVAEGLRRDGYQVLCYGVPEVADSAAELELLLAQAGCVILPLPAVGEDGCLGGLPTVTPRELLHRLRPGCVLFGGRLGGLAAMAVEEGVVAVDYAALDALAAANAVPTAEGALQIAMEELPITLQGSHALVVGFGRVGRILSRKLQVLGAAVTATARRSADCAMIRALGMRSDETGRFSNGLEQYDLVVNTVPALIFDRARLEQLRPDCLLLDLASKPGGVDFPAAAELGRHVIWALSLPGRVAPVTAGTIIKDVILEFLERPTEV